MFICRTAAGTGSLGFEQSQQTNYAAVSVFGFTTDELTLFLGLLVWGLAT